MNSHTLGPLISIVVIAIVLAIRLRRGSRAMRLRLEMLWITPAVLIGLAVLLLIQMPPRSDQLLWLGVAAAAGAVLGWYRGAIMRITVDPQTHALNQQASPAAMIFIVALIAIRFALRTVLAEEAQAWHLDPIFITDIFFIFIVGLLCTQRLEMALRARRLLFEARMARAQA